MAYKHTEHWENILLYGQCDCGVNKNSSKSFKQLVKDLKK